MEPASDDCRPPWLWPRAAYVHIPFCAHHCGYCDFAVAVGQDQHIDDYLRALHAELRRLESPQPVDTLFFGGGTPTYLSHRQLRELLRMVLDWLPLRTGHEFSVEANPSHLDEEKIGILAAHGVNRISLGVQSFEREVLRVLERDHQPHQALEAVDFIRTHIPNFSLDLIFGVPGQTLALWQHDLDRALALAPTHLSTYGLTYETGTRLWNQRRQGQVTPLAEEAELAFYTEAMDRIEAAGLEHYEISNFTRPGFRCRHNQVYWANHAHFGFGVGAARYVEGARSLNTRSLQGYVRRALTGEPTAFQTEVLPPRERALETMAIQLRRAEGIDRIDFQRQTGIPLDELVGARLSALCDLALLHDDGVHVRLTRQGKCVADAVIEQLL